jgi:hypothetical protein
MVVAELSTAWLSPSGLSPDGKIALCMRIVSRLAQQEPPTVAARRRTIAQMQLGRQTFGHGHDDRSDHDDVEAAVHDEGVEPKNQRRRVRAQNRCASRKIMSAIRANPVLTLFWTMQRSMRRLVNEHP